MTFGLAGGARLVLAGGGRGWLWVAAGGVALLVAVPRTLPIALRVVAAGAGLVPLGLVLVAPATDESTTVGTLAVVAVAACLVALMALAPSPWGATGLAGGALCALVLGYQVAYLGYAAARRAQLTAVVTTAAPLTDEQTNRLSAALQRIYSKPILIQQVQDEDVIGGIRVQVGDEVVDGTVLRRLDEARRLLEASELPIEQVAAVCGFGNAVTLRQNFVSTFGSTPSSYRKRFATVL